MCDKWGYEKRTIDPFNITPEDKAWMKSRVRKHDLFFGFGVHVGQSIVDHIGILLGNWADAFGFFDFGMTQNNDPTDRAWLFLNLRASRADSVWIVCRPADDVLGECRAVKEYLAVDSTYRRMFVRQGDEPGWGRDPHREVCCWKELMGGTQPWPDNPSPYACLSWDHNAQHTWDTLVSPRIDLRGCSGAKLFQMSRSTLSAGTRRVLGSTDDGATWPCIVGDDELQEADVTWADGHQQVRLAWSYSGPVSLSKYWALDEIWVMARPAHDHDMCVTEARPWEIVSHGTPVQPWAHVVNHGEKTDSCFVTMKIGDYLYSQTRQVYLAPYCDTSLRFSPDWVATPGTHTVVAYASLPGDEFRGNDSVVMQVRVVADTWVMRYGLGNDVDGGAALCRATDDTLYLLRGAATPSKDFLLYLVGADLWKRRRAAPSGFQNGSDLAYPGGDYIYVCDGSENFFRYRISTNTWETRASVPGDMGSGGGLAWAGGNYIYALRGRSKKDFYRYSISGNSWTQLADIPQRVKYGGAMCWTGGNYIYVMRGDESRDFYRYSISGNSWESRAPTPYALPGAYNGADMTWDYTHDVIYATLGDNCQYFLKYDIATNTWARVYNTPKPVKLGGALAYCDYSVFGIMGKDYTTDVFWRYSTGDTAQPPEPPPPPPPPSPPQQGGGAGIVMQGQGHGFPVLSQGNLGQLAFIDTDTTNESEAGRLYVLAEGDTEVCLTPDFEVNLEPPSWSPNESTLAVASEHGLRLIDADDTTSVMLDSGLVSSPSWSPDGAWVAYTKWDDGHGLCKVSADGAELICLCQGEDFSNPGWAPDGMTIVAEKDVDGRRQLVLVDAETGEQQALTDDYWDNTSPVFTPDGEWVYFNKTDHTGYRQVYRIKPYGTDEVPVTGEDQCQHGAPDISPDGTWVCFTTSSTDVTGQYYGCSRVEAVSVATGQRIDLTDGNATRRTPAWGPIRHDSPEAYAIAYEERVSADATDAVTKQPRVVSRLVYLPRQPAGAAGIPSRYILHQNVPNPFRLRTVIRFGVPAAGRVSLQVYDLTGRVVRVLANDSRKPGYYSVAWDARDGRGREVPAGVYFYELRTDEKVLERKMLLLK